MESKFLPPKGLNCHRSLSVSSPEPTPQHKSISTAAFFPSRHILLSQRFLKNNWPKLNHLPPLHFTPHLRQQGLSPPFHWTSLTKVANNLHVDKSGCHLSGCLNRPLWHCWAAPLSRFNTMTLYPLPSNFLAALWSPLPTLPHPLAPYPKNVTVPHSLTFGLFSFFLPGRLHAGMSIG